MFILVKNLRGVPTGTWWPSIKVSESGNQVRIYVKSDDAEFTVASCNIQVFDPSASEIQRSENILKKKKRFGCLEAFRYDLKWALEGCTTDETRSLDEMSKSPGPKRKEFSPAHVIPQSESDDEMSQPQVTERKELSPARVIPQSESDDEMSQSEVTERKDLSPAHVIPQSRSDDEMSQSQVTERKELSPARVIPQSRSDDEMSQPQVTERKELSPAHVIPQSESDDEMSQSQVTERKELSPARVIPQSESDNEMSQSQVTERKELSPAHVIPQSESDDEMSQSQVTERKELSPARVIPQSESDDEMSQSQVTKRKELSPARVIPQSESDDEMSQSQVTKRKELSPAHVIPQSESDDEMSQSQVTERKELSPARVIPQSESDNEMSQSEVTEGKDLSPAHVIPQSESDDEMSQSQVTKRKELSPARVIPQSESDDEMSQSQVTKRKELSPARVIPQSESDDEMSQSESDNEMSQSQVTKRKELSPAHEFSQSESDNEISQSGDEALSSWDVLIKSLYEDSSEVSSVISVIQELQSEDDETSLKETWSHDKMNSEIKIPAVQEKNGQNVKRIFNKRSACLFCGNVYSNISKHYTAVHKKEPKVAEIIALKEGVQGLSEIKQKWELLRHLGNHQHNLKVVAEKKGELMLVRRKKGKTFSVEDYGPCPQCKGWFLKTALYVHVNYRCLRKGKDNLRSSSILIRSEQHKKTKTNILDLEVICTMRCDNLTEVAKNDALIRKLGEFYYLKHNRNMLRRKNFASKHMRAAADLLIRAQRISSSTGDMSSYLKPQMFSIIEKAAIQMAGGEDTDYNELPHPSTLKNMGYEVKHLVDLKEENAIMNADNESLAEAENFRKLYRRRWTLLSNSAQKQLEERTYNKSVSLPSTTDLQKVSTFIKQQLSNVTDVPYQDLIQLVQSRLILFNKRRPGELEALRIGDFQRRKNNDVNILPEVSLTELEKKLLQSHDVITVRGKRGNAVPILIPSDTLASMERLVDKDFRRRAGVKDTNEFLFANTGDEVHRAVTSLKQVLWKAGINSKIASDIKATTLRKYLATNCQLMNLNDSELDWVVRHMGHTKMTHMSNYRLSSSTIERTKIAKLLLLMENGMLEKAQGQNLSDSRLDELILKKLNSSTQSDADSIGDTSDCPTEDGKISKGRKLRHCGRSQPELAEDDETTVHFPKGRTSRHSVRSHSESTEGGETGVPFPVGRTTRQSVRSQPDCPTEDGEIEVRKGRTTRHSVRSQPDCATENGETEVHFLKTSRRRTGFAIGKKRRRTFRCHAELEYVTTSESDSDPPPQKVARRNRPWPSDAVTALRREFQDHFQNGTYPSFQAIQKVKDRYPLWLGERSLPQIKAKLLHLKQRKN